MGVSSSEQKIFAFFDLPEIPCRSLNSDCSPFSTFEAINCSPNSFKRPYGEANQDICICKPGYFKYPIFSVPEITFFCSECDKDDPDTPVICDSPGTASRPLCTDQGGIGAAYTVEDRIGDPCNCVGGYYDKDFENCMDCIEFCSECNLSGKGLCQ